MAEVLILIPAAGASTRMRGRDKLMEPVDGIPILRRQVAAALRASPMVMVTLSADRPERASSIADLPVSTTLVMDAIEGMSASLRLGARLAPTFAADLRPEALMVLPADMPELTADDLGTVIAAHRKDRRAILRGAGADGTPGHPVLFPSDLWPDLAALHGDAGARSVLIRHANRVQLVPLPEAHALTDLDTPEDWAAWRRRTGRADEAGGAA